MSTNRYDALRSSCSGVVGKRIDDALPNKGGLFQVMMLWSLLAGLIAGFVLGFLGAGGTVVGIPFLLFFARLTPHIALGTNALGVSLIAAALLIWRIWKKEISLRPGVMFTIPGILGDFIGARIGLAYPGQKLIFLLGLLLFAIAAWLFYLSVQMDRRAGSRSPPAAGPGVRRKSRRAWLTIPVAFGVGALAGFFAIGGGFMIVPAIAFTEDLDLMDAAGIALLPITVFAGFVGFEYLAAGSANLILTAGMLVPGLLGGVAGIRLARRLPKTLIYRLFAVFLVALGVYMIVK